MSGQTRLRRQSACLSLILLLVSTLLAFAVGRAQQDAPAWLDEAARRTGLSREELLRRLAQGQGFEPTLPVDTTATTEPGRKDLSGIDDSRPRRPGPRVILPFDLAAAETVAAQPCPLVPDSLRMPLEDQIFGSEFFQLDAGVFNPTTFGPVPQDYRIGVGDQIVVDVWGEVEFRLERVVDRDGSIILPKGGKIFCADLTLADVAQKVRERLSRSYSGISPRPGEGSTFLDVSLGQLRAIRVYVVGDAAQPGAYELSSVSTIFTALYAAGGPTAAGSLREIRLMRDGQKVAALDFYDYLLAGRREGDALLREGDTVFIPPHGKSVHLRGEVRRPRIFELKAEENLADLLRFGGGVTSQAATEVIHIERVLPPAERVPERPDRVMFDVPLDASTGLPRDAQSAALVDGDKVTVGRIAERLENWVEIQGNVKRPGRFEFREGMDVTELVALADGLWRDTLGERALIDRVAEDGSYLAIAIPLADVLAGRVAPVPLRPMDQLRVFSLWDVQDRYDVRVTGEVRAPGSFPYRQGMTLRDVILKAGGLKESADVLRAEISRLRLDAIESRDTSSPPADVVDVLEVALGENYLAGSGDFLLRPHDQIAIRKLPWWELQRTVVMRGEVLYPGVYSLERPDERLSEIVRRAGGLKPTAFASGARIIRSQDKVGNIALDLRNALAEPGAEQDVILKAGDEIRIPETPHIVKVIGSVGFPTGIVHTKGKGISYYIDRAGGYAEGADKWKTRVVYANGMSRPVKRIWRDPKVLPGSTIVVPEKPPPEGAGKLETLKDIAAIFASVATVYLVIDRTAN